MPSLDPYGDLDFDDDIGMQAFLQAHAARHSSYQQAAMLQGLAFADTNLNDYPDDDWFQRHYVVHVQLNSLLAANPTIYDPTVNIATLVDYNWDNADDFFSWMQMHTRIHQRIDQFFGNTG
jgi:hypothetical protein